MTALLALLAAVGYGASDFFGGLGSRKVPGFAITVASQISNAVVILLAVMLTGASTSGPALEWGALAGLGGGAGVAFLYRGLGAGQMGVVAPVSALGAAVLPVLAGVALGERPSLLVWLGVVAALPAVWLVAAGTTAREPQESARQGVIDGSLAGAGFGLFFIAIGQVPADAGLAPLASTQVVGLASVVLLAVATRSPWLPRDRAAGWGIWAGVLGALSSVAFLLAAQSGLLTVAAVLASLYPAVTVILAVLVLRERIHRPQAIGLLLCLAAVVLVAIG